MTNTNIQSQAKALITHMIGDDDFLGTPDDWQGVLYALEDGEALHDYFGDADEEQDKINQEIVEEAYYMVEKTIAGIEDENEVKAQMRNALRARFKGYSKEELIKGPLIAAEISIGLMTFICSIVTRYQFDYDDTAEMIASKIDDLVNDAAEEMDEENLVVNL